MATDPMWCYEQYVEAAEYIDMIEEQRDELLAALESMVREFDYTCGDKFFLERNRTQALYKARATIASVKGK